MPRTISALSKLKGVGFENNRLSGARLDGNNFTACTGMSPACVPPTCSWQLVAVAEPLGDTLIGKNDAATEPADVAMEQLHEAEVATEVTASPSPSHGMWDMEDGAPWTARNILQSVRHELLCGIWLRGSRLVPRGLSLIMLRSKRSKKPGRPLPQAARMRSYELSE